MLSPYLMNLFSFICFCIYCKELIRMTLPCQGPSGIFCGFKIRLNFLELLHKPGDIFIFSPAGLMTFPNSFSGSTQAGL